MDVCEDFDDLMCRKDFTSLDQGKNTAALVICITYYHANLTVLFVLISVSAVESLSGPPQFEQVEYKAVEHEDVEFEPPPM